MNQAFAALLEENGISFEENLPMAAYTTFRIGGPADLAVFPADERQLAFCLGLFAGEAIVLGNGSNVLVSDRGIAGAVILLGSSSLPFRGRGTASRRRPGQSSPPYLPPRWTRGFPGWSSPRASRARWAAVCI